MLTPVQMVLNGAKKYHSEFFVVLGDLMSICAVSTAGCPDILPVQLSHSASTRSPLCATDIGFPHCRRHPYQCLFAQQQAIAPLRPDAAYACLSLAACGNLSLTSLSSVVIVLASAQPSSMYLGCMTQASLQQTAQLHS